MSIFSVGGSTPSDAVESKSLRFNRDDSAYLSKTFSSDGNRTTWTLSTWVKVTDTTNQNPIIGVAPNTNNAFTLALTPHIDFYNYVLGSGYVWRKKSSAVYRDVGSWLHLVAVLDTSNATAEDRARLYVNGERITDWSVDSDPSSGYAATWWNDASYQHRIGNEASSTSFKNGNYLAEFHFIDGTALDASYFGETDSITGQWKPKTAADIKEAVTFGENGFHLPFSNDALADSFTDSAEKFATAGGAVHTDTTVKKWGTASAQFNGSSSYLTVPDSSPFSLFANTTDSKTLDFWVNHTAVGSGQVYFMPREDGSNYWFIRHDTPNILLYGKIGNSVFINQSASAFSNTGAWHHIALVKIANKLGVYVDGTQIIYTTFSSTKDFAAPLTIGSQDGSSDFFNGYMDEVRWSDSNVFNANPNSTPNDTITVPTGAFTPDSNTKLLLHMDGADNGTSFPDSSESGGRHTITANGGATNERIQPNARMVAAGEVHIIGPKTTGYSSSIFFGEGGASGNGISVASSSDFQFSATDPFTVECWCNMTRFPAAAAQYFFNCNDTLKLAYDTGYAFWRFGGGSNQATWAPGAGQPHLNEWMHIAIVGDGVNVKGYVGGVERVSFAQAGTAGSSGATFYIGVYNGTSHAVAGYIEEFRISNVARYTANYTPSADPFTSDANTKLLIHSNTTMGSTTFTDSSSSAHTLTALGDVMNVAPKIGTGMGVWDGQLTSPGPTYIETVDAPGTWAFGTEDFTWDFWVYSDGWTNNETFYEAYAASNDYWEFRIKTGGDLALTSVVGGSTVVNLNFNNANIPTGAWAHVELSRSGSTFRCFINGTETGDAQTSSGSLGTAARQLKIGRSGRLNTVWKGYMDEHRISKGIVRHTSNFTPSTTALTDDKDTVLLLHMDGGGPGAPGSSTNIGQGTYFYDDSTNAIFYDSGVPKYKSYMAFDGSGDYLSVPSSSDFALETSDFTVEMWLSPKDMTTNARTIYDVRTPSNTNGPYMYFDTSETLFVNNGAGGEISTDLDIDRWYHIAYVRDSNTIRLYKDGTQVGSATVSTFSDTSNRPITIGRSGRYQNYYYNGYVDGVRISNNCRYTNGTAFTPPTDRFTADANTKLLIQSDFSEGGIGADHSGNYNYFTPTNLGSEDMVLDSPTNNFCTLNGVDADSGLVLSEGNLQGTNTGSAQWEQASATFIIPKSGKWYWEAYIKQDKAHLMLFFDRSSEAYNGDEVDNLYVWDCQSSSNNIKYNTSAVASSDVAVGDIISVSVNDGEVKFYKNNTLAHTFTQNMSLDSKDYVPGMSAHSTSSGGQLVFNFGQDSSFAGNKTAQGNTDGNGKGDFYYTPPSGFLALCTDNLDDPSIADPTAHFNTVLYTGNGSTGHAITGVGFQPDLTWVKNRDTTNWHNLVDSVRTVSAGTIYSNATSAESGSAANFSSFDSDGFTVENDSNFNTNNENYASWNWKAGGTASSNTDGTITSSVSANTDAGFSIVSYTGDGTNGATVGHGLSSAPELIIQKRRDATWSWGVFDGTIGATKYLYLNSDVAAVTHSGFWNNTAPTASVFSIAAFHTNVNTSTNIAYCFHSVDGYSKVGSYTGNANADGPFVYTGFKPAFVIIKQTTTANWFIYDDARDTYNVVEDTLKPSTNDIETDVDTLDFVSNGFKIRHNSATSSINDNGISIIYLAFAESPFKTSNAR